MKTNNLQNTPGSRKRPLGSRKPAPGIRKRTLGNRKPTPGIRNRTPGNRLTSLGIRHRTPAIRQHHHGNRNPTPGNRLTTLGIRNPVPAIRKHTRWKFFHAAWNFHSSFVNRNSSFTPFSQYSIRNTQYAFLARTHPVSFPVLSVAHDLLASVIIYQHPNFLSCPDSHSCPLLRISLFPSIQNTHSSDARVPRENTEWFFRA